jgi:hypothetical protein
MKERVDAQLQQAAVLTEALHFGESPNAAWSEIQSLTRTRTQAEARAIASQIIGFAVAWRCCKHVRPSVFDELCDDEFCVEDLCVTASAGVALTLEVVDAATGEMTPRKDRVKVVPGFCFSHAVEEVRERESC